MTRLLAANNFGKTEAAATIERFNNNTDLFRARLVLGWVTVFEAHRRKLLLGPGAQAPPLTFMIMGLAYMTSLPNFVT